ncbi:unnamed protein product [Cuscuta epithymum]|uniref:Hypoxanthine phosphoribosyltransferase n=1 Tax=Cuscuta epithymum TaxID=186058 RepID=A0AAV0DZH8_9ASTE|nr:unnamed protein product [Cuscuta epithymum]
MTINMDDHIERVLWTEHQIADRVSSLASEITHQFSSAAAAAPVFVGVANGAFIFLADLVRKINLPITVDSIRVSSYGSGSVSSGKPSIYSDLKIDVQGKHVVLVEDIVDTGHTLSCLIDHLKAKGASSVSVCALLDKSSRRKVNLELVGDGKFYCGFQCPDSFVVGYGLDFAEQYRNLTYVGVLKAEMYNNT